MWDYNKYDEGKTNPLSKKDAVAALTKMGHKPKSVITVGRTPRAQHVNDQLFSEAIRLAAELGCGTVIIENVAGFSSKLGEGGMTLADAAVRQLEVRAACRWGRRGAAPTPSHGCRRQATVRIGASWMRRTTGFLSGGGGRSSWQQKLRWPSGGPRLQPAGRPASGPLPWATRRRAPPPWAPTTCT